MPTAPITAQPEEGHGGGFGDGERSRGNRQGAGFADGTTVLGQGDNEAGRLRHTLIRGGEKRSRGEGAQDVIRNRIGASGPVKSVGRTDERSERRVAKGKRCRAGGRGRCRARSAGAERQNGFIIGVAIEKMGRVIHGPVEVAGATILTREESGDVEARGRKNAAGVDRGPLGVPEGVAAVDQIGTSRLAHRGQA